MSVDIDGQIYVQEKILNVTSSTFGLEVSKLESKEYVADSSSTKASEITILELEYTKAE